MGERETNRNWERGREGESETEKKKGKIQIERVKREGKE